MFADAIANGGSLVTVLVALLGGGMLASIYQIYQGRKRGPTEMQDLVMRVSNQVMGGAQDLLNEYRIQLEAAQRQVDAYLEQLANLNRLLGEANARIARLEDALSSSAGERESLRKELDDVRRHRDELVEEINVLRRRVDELSERSYFDQN